MNTPGCGIWRASPGLTGRLLPAPLPLWAAGGRGGSASPRRPGQGCAHPVSSLSACFWSGDSPPGPTVEVVDLGVPRGVRSAGAARGPAAHVPPLVPCAPRLWLRLQGDICASVDICLSLSSSLVSSCLQAVAALPITLKAPVPSSWRQLTILSFRGRLPRSPSCHAP